MANADIGGGEGRGVVDAVARHGDHMIAGLQAADRGVLVLRKDLGNHLGNAELAGDRVGGGTVVASQHHDPDALIAKPTKGVNGGGFDRVRDSDGTSRAAIDGDEQRRVVDRAIREGDRQISHQAAVAQHHGMAGDGARDSLAGYGAKVGGLDHRQVARAPRRRWRQRVGVRWTAPAMPQA
jgi:hypothetical protein